MKTFHKRSFAPARTILSRLSILLISGLLLVSNIAPASAQLAVPNLDAIDTYVANEMNAARIPGLALAIVKGNQVVHLKGFGKADEAGRAVTPQTPFIIGSTTKSFTALATMQLVEAGKVELDAPAQKYLPWFRVADAEISKRITIRHLLNQTSGLPASAGSSAQTTPDPSRAALEKQVRALENVAVKRAPGEAFEYSGVNFMILGLVIEAVSGKTYEQYIQEQIFAPLEMKNSYADFSGAKQLGLAQGYTNWFGLYVPNDPGITYNRAILPTGHLIVSGEDMAHYLIAHLNGSYANASVLSRAGMAELHKPATSAGMMGNSTSYAMGWFVSEIGGAPAVWVQGDIPTFWSEAIIVPEGGWGVAVLMNGSDLKKTRGTTISAGVLNMLTGRQPPPTPGISPMLIAVYAILGVIVPQFVGLVRSIRLLHLARSHLEIPPRGNRAMTMKIWLPLLLNLFWAAVCLIIAPMLLGYSLSVLWMQDLGEEIIVSGLLALAGGVVMMALGYFTLRSRGTIFAAGKS